jgi:integrase
VRGLLARRQTLSHVARNGQQEGLPIGRDSGYTIHSLRHSFETICVNASIPQRAVDTWLGHSADKSMGAVYYRLKDEDSQAFMKRVPFGLGASVTDIDNEGE